ncbi:MAG: tetratricopeptide repeat protein, partial [Symploca sp. SIO1A3]|nr:tetratricopeptide repeat protein [Symploca sp. SIO1A3]
THRVSIASFREFIQIGVNIAQGQAKVDDYLLFAYLNAVDGNFTKAVNHYSQALDLAVKNNDIEGQAIARNNMGEVFLTTGNLKEAIFILTLARDMYQSLGNDQRFGEVKQRLAEIGSLLKVSPSGSKIELSKLQFDLSRI